MKKLSTLKTLLVGLCAMAATSAWADDITSLPANYDYTTQDALDNNSISPFDVGTVRAGKNVKALTISNQTSTAWFDSDVNTDERQPYAIANNEKVTITIDSYHGWLSNGKNATVTVYAPEGQALASYAYNVGSCNLSDVKIGGETVSGFDAVNFQNKNGLTPNNNQFITTGNPQTTISISSSGYVEMTFKKGSDVIASYSGQLNLGTIKLEKIAITDLNNNYDRSYHIGKLSISTETVSEANVTYKFVDMNGNSIKDDASAPATINSSIADVIPSSYKASFFNSDQTKKYQYNSFECSDQEVPSTGTVVTLKFKELSKYSYTVTSSYDSNVLPFSTSGEVWEDEPSVTIRYPRFQLSGSILVEKAPNNNNLTTIINVTSNNYAEDLVYTKTNHEDVCLLSEAEDLPETGLTIGSTSFSDRVSNNKIGYGDGTKTLFTLQPGYYKMVLGVIGGAANNIATYVVNAGEEEIINDNCQGNFLSQLESKTFRLTSETAITVTLGNTNKDRGIDLVYVKNLGTVYAYSIKLTSEDGKINNVIENGLEKSGEIKTITYNKYINVDGVLYEAQPTDNGYTASFTIDEDNKECKIVYTPTSITDVVYYSEGESIEGVGVISSGEIYNQASGKKGGAGENITVTNLESGNYLIVARFGGKADKDFNVSVGEENIIDIKGKSTGNLTEYSGDVSLSSSADVKFTGGYVTTSNNAYGLDYIYIKRLTSVAVRISNAGYATYINSKYPLDFSNVDGLTAYTASANGERVEFTEAGKVPANTGVLLKGAAKTYNVPIVTDGGDATSLLIGGTTAPAGSFVLMKVEDKVGFYKTKDKEEFTLTANTAYIPSTASAREFIAIDDEATGISAVKGAEQSSEVFNLNGQRVNKAQKGLYIQNGKKVVVK